MTRDLVPPSKLETWRLPQDPTTTTTTTTTTTSTAVNENNPLPLSAFYIGFRGGTALPSV
jgi:hypothetical protein